MAKKPYTKLIHEGGYAAEVDLDLLVTDDEWSPYRTPEDAYKLDEAREALRRGNMRDAARLARIFELVPVAA
jgi:hypothetical protein